MKVTPKSTSVPMVEQANCATNNPVSHAIADSASGSAESLTEMIAAAKGAQWYVMRVTYQRELAARKIFEQLGIEAFVPTQRVRRRQAAGKYCFREVSRLHNYIFVHTSLEVLQQVKTLYIPYLRYMMGKNEDGQPVKQFVPRDQMENFIAICRSEQAKMLDPMGGLRKGDRVRILVGPLRGVEGIYVRTSARHEKCVVVEIEGVAAVATAAYRATEVEKI